MLDLDSAIQHCHEKAKELRSKPKLTPVDDYYEDYCDCLECANEHEQLAKWLTELKKLREVMRQVKFNAYAITKWIEEQDNDS